MDADIEMLRNDTLSNVYKDQKVVKAILSDLAESGEIVKVDSSYYISSNGWEKAVNAVKKIGLKNNFTLAEYRDILGTSRKYATLFLQAFDKEGITVFDGETRKLI